MTADVTDRELIIRAKEGNSAAFGSLVERYLRPALAIAWEYAPSRDDAEDLVQDAFHRSLRKLKRFDERRQFGPWLFTIIRNLGRNAVSRNSRWAAVPVPDELQSGSDPHSDVESKEVIERVERDLETLPPMQRSCFRLCRVEGFDSAEVAEMLGIGKATVRTHVQRAREALQKKLGVLRDERNER
jgi:RNA polymerase sigma-70 factor (ECF subfamily)